MYESPHIPEQLIHDRQERRLSEARARRLVKLAEPRSQGLHERVLSGLGEQLISIGSHLKERYSRAPRERSGRPFDRVL